MLLLVPAVYARSVPQLMDGGLRELNSFFEAERFRAYAVAIDFFVFTIIFMSIYMIGARYAFKEVKNPEKAIVVILGLLTSILLVLAGFSIMMLIPYIHWLLYFLVFMLLWWLLKDMDSKFWRFLLAVLLTLLVIALVWWLWNNFSAPDVGSVSAPNLGISDWFGNFGKVGGVNWNPGVPEWMNDFMGSPESESTNDPGTVTVVENPNLPERTPDATPANPDEQGDSKWKWLVFLLPLLALGLVGWGLWKSRREGRQGEGVPWWKRIWRKIWPERKGQAAAEEEQVMELEDVLKEIKKYHDEKYALLLKIYELFTEKKKLKDRIDVYHKRLHQIIYSGLARGKTKEGEDISYILDPDSQLHRELIDSNNDIDKVIKLEFDVAIALKDFIKLENEILGKENGTDGNLSKLVFIDKANKGRIHAWQASVFERLKVDDEEFLKLQNQQYTKYARILKMHIQDGVQNVTRAAKSSAIHYFKITGAKIKEEKELQNLQDEKEIKKILEPVALQRWIKLVEMKDLMSQDGDADFEKFRNFNTNDKDEKAESYFLRPGKDKREWDIFGRNEGFWSRRLFVRINHEKKILRNVYFLIRILQKIGRKALMQNLVISKEVEEDNVRKFVPATEEAGAKGFSLGTPIRISTRIASGVNPFDVNLYIYRKVSSGIYRLLKKIPGVKYLKKIPGIRSLVDSKFKPHQLMDKSKYNQAMPEDYPAVPSVKDFATQDEYNAAVADFEAKQNNYYTNPRFTTQAANVIDEFEFVSNGENGFGDLDPGEYKIIVAIRGGDSEGLARRGELGIDIPFNDLDIRAIRRYGWDVKYADLIIKGQKAEEESDETVQVEGCSITKINGKPVEIDLSQKKIAKVDKRTGIKTIEAILRPGQPRYYFYKVFRVVKRMRLRDLRLNNLKDAGKIFRKGETLEMHLKSKIAEIELGPEISQSMEIGGDYPDGVYVVKGYVASSQDGKDAKLFDLARVEVGEQLEVVITEPLEDVTLYVDSYLSLEAEVKGPKEEMSELIDSINQEKDGFTFEWRIEQKGRWWLLQRRKTDSVHEGRETEFRLPVQNDPESRIKIHSDRVVSGEFREGKAVLIVAVKHNGAEVISSKPMNLTIKKLSTIEEVIDEESRISKYLRRIFGEKIDPLLKLLDDLRVKIKSSDRVTLLKDLGRWIAGISTSIRDRFRKLLNYAIQLEMLERLRKKYSGEDSKEEKEDEDIIKLAFKNLRIINYNLDLINTLLERDDLSTEQAYALSNIREYCRALIKDLDCAINVLTKVKGKITETEFRHYIDVKDSPDVVKKLRNPKEINVLYEIVVERFRDGNLSLWTKNDSVKAKDYPLAAMQIIGSIDSQNNDVSRILAIIGEDASKKEVPEEHSRIINLLAKGKEFVMDFFTRKNAQIPKMRINLLGKKESPVQGKQQERIRLIAIIRQIRKNLGEVLLKGSAVSEINPEWDKVSQQIKEADEAISRLEAAVVQPEMGVVGEHAVSAENEAGQAVADVIRGIRNIVENSAGTEVTEEDKDAVSALSKSLVELSKLERSRRLQFIEYMNYLIVKGKSIAPLIEAALEEMSEKIPQLKKRIDAAIKRIKKASKINITKKSSRKEKESAVEELGEAEAEVLEIIELARDNSQGQYQEVTDKHGDIAAEVSEPAVDESAVSQEQIPEAAKEPEISLLANARSGLIELVREIRARLPKSKPEADEIEKGIVEFEKKGALKKDDSLQRIDEDKKEQIRIARRLKLRAYRTIAGNKNLGWIRDIYHRNKGLQYFIQKIPSDEASIIPKKTGDVNLNYVNREKARIAGLIRDFAIETANSNLDKEKFHTAIKRMISRIQNKADIPPAVFAAKNMKKIISEGMDVNEARGILGEIIRISQDYINTLRESKKSADVEYGGSLAEAARRDKKRRIRRVEEENGTGELKRPSARSVLGDSLRLADEIEEGEKPKE